MKPLHQIILISLCLITSISCFPPMQEGPNPHTIEFQREGFNEILQYFQENPAITNFNVSASPNEVSEEILKKMRKIGFLHYKNWGNYQTFTCGYGVLGLSWGFIYGKFTDKEIEDPKFNIESELKEFTITYLKNLEGDWYRFGAGER